MGKANNVKLSLEEQATKVCRKCGEEKHLAEFYKRVERGRTTYRSHCKTCIRAYDLTRVELNYLRGVEYRNKNKDRIAKSKKAYSEANREKELENKRRYNRENRARLSREKTKRRHENWNLRISNSLRGSLRKLLVGEIRKVSAVRDLGCDLPFLKRHLEKQFDPFMTWENYGEYWHVDHIYPMAAANLSVQSELLAVINWRNLQPLEASKNCSKRDKVTTAARRLFNKLVKEFS